MHSRRLVQEVALVFPPFGPQFIPSLGLALLSAGLKQAGFACRTFYWNLDFAGALPGRTPDERIRLYEGLTKLTSNPLNEWLFARIVFPDVGDSPSVQRRLSALDGDRPRRGWLRSLGHREAPTVGRRMLDELRERSTDFVDQMVDRLAPFDVVGVASTFFQNMPALALARRVKERWPHKVVVLGGANCDDVMGTTLLEEFGFIDYVFSGEVDFSFPEFVSRLRDGRPVADVPGLVYRDPEGRVVRAPEVAPLGDMDSLPVPDYDDFIAQRERSDLGTTSQALILALESSRGCWWGAKQHCVFCGLNANGMAYRQKAYDRFQAEVEQIVDRYHPRFLFMTDNILSAGYYKEFLDWAGRRGLGVDFFYEIKANLNRQQVEGLADAGISWIQPGIESFSSSTLTLMKKGVRGIQNVALLKYARDNGLRTSYGILGGFTGEDHEEYAKMAAQLPRLVHLEPPAGAWKVQYHRFSPMFRNPPTVLRPSREYFEIYPLPEQTLSKLAYYFEPAQPQEFPHEQTVRESVNQWKRAWNPATCTLTWERSGPDILIRDRRPGFPARNIRLAGYAVAVFHALDKPRQLSGLIRDLGAPAERSVAELEREGARPLARDEVDETLVAFTRQAFEERPDACVGPLVDAGLLYVEEDLYLTLPVRADHRAYPRQWQYRDRPPRRSGLLGVLGLRRASEGHRRVSA